MKYYNNVPSSKIRKKLDSLCNGENYPFDHPIKYMQVFFPEFASCLEIVSPPPQRVSQYNCFAYALGLDLWVRTYTFYQAVLNRDLKETETPAEGDIVVYYENNLIKHAGKYESRSKVISKWAGGPIFKHETFMCPATYGDSVKYFKSVAKEDSKKILGKYPVLN